MAVCVEGNKQGVSSQTRGEQRCVLLNSRDPVRGSCGWTWNSPLREAAGSGPERVAREVLGLGWPTPWPPDSSIVFS